MSKPSKEQIAKYEYEHKVLFISLVIANNLWLAMPGKYKFNPNDKASAKYKSWFALGKKIADLVGKWAGRQYKLEVVPDGAPKVPKEIYTYFLKKDKMKPLSDYAMSLVKPGTSAGIGFIPLLIWGAIALIAAFSAAYIIDETTTTAQEKADLLKQTESTLKELGIPPDKAAEIIKDTQAQASENKGLFGGSGGLILPLGIGALLLLLMNNKKST